MKYKVSGLIKTGIILNLISYAVLVILEVILFFLCIWGDSTGDFIVNPIVSYFQVLMLIVSYFKVLMLIVSYFKVPILIMVIAALIVTIIFIVLHIQVFKGKASNGIRIFIGVMSCTYLSGVCILAGEYKEKNLLKT